MGRRSAFTLIANEAGLRNGLLVQKAACDLATVKRKLPGTFPPTYFSSSLSDRVAMSTWKTRNAPEGRVAVEEDEVQVLGSRLSPPGPRLAPRAGPAYGGHLGRAGDIRTLQLAAILGPAGHSFSFRWERGKTGGRRPRRLGLAALAEGEKKNTWLFPLLLLGEPPPPPPPSPRGWLQGCWPVTAA